LMWCFFFFSKICREKSNFRCDIRVVFYKLSTKYTTISRKTRQKLLYYVVQYVSQLHVSALFCRPSSGCVHKSLRVMYPIYKYTTLMMRSHSSLYNFSLNMAGMYVDYYGWALALGVGWQGSNNVPYCSVTIA